MKTLTEDEVGFLFEWVKNWYPTEAKPKIAILLLNRQEWRRFYLQKRARISHEELYKKLDKRINKYPKKTQILFQQVRKLPQAEKNKIIKMIIPHFDEREQRIEHWMNETAGKCFSMERLKEMREILEQALPPFFQPYLNYDFVIIISNFFTKEQKKKFESKFQRKLIIYATIFHELIHVIEHCTGTRIFKSGSLDESIPITFHLARKYLENER